MLCPFFSFHCVFVCLFSMCCEDDFSSFPLLSKKYSNNVHFGISQHAHIKLYIFHTNHHHHLTPPVFIYYQCFCIYSFFPKKVICFSFPFSSSIFLEQKKKRIPISTSVCYSFNINTIPHSLLFLLFAIESKQMLFHGSHARRRHGHARGAQRRPLNDRDAVLRGRHRVHAHVHGSHVVPPPPARVVPHVKAVLRRGGTGQHRRARRHGWRRWQRGPRDYCLFRPPDDVQRHRRGEQLPHWVDAAEPMQQLDRLRVLVARDDAGNIWWRRRGEGEEPQRRRRRLRRARCPLLGPRLVGAVVEQPGVVAVQQITRQAPLVLLVVVVVVRVCGLLRR
eukprot:PhM_4_TR9393/c0_g1_i1/m.65198